jgi:hypothetical protein
MNALFPEMIVTLREARQALDSELEALKGAKFLDRDSLARVEEAELSLEEQADSLAMMTSDRDAPQALVEEAEDLFDFFRQVEERAEAIIQASQE